MVTTSDGFIDVYIGFRFGECVAVFDTEDNANLVINTTQPMIATLDLPAWEGDYREAVLSDNVEVVKIILDLP